MDAQTNEPARRYSTSSTIVSDGRASTIRAPSLDTQTLSMSGVYTDNKYPDAELIKHLFARVDDDVAKRTSQSCTGVDESPQSSNAAIGIVRAMSEDEEDGPRIASKPVGFWHSGLKATRVQVLKKYTLTLLILCIAVLGILSIYWGVLVDVKQNLYKASVAVVSFEGRSPYQEYTPVVTPFITQALEAEMASRPDHLGFQFRDASEFDNDPMRVRLAVFEEKYWAAIIIHANATALLTQAVQQGNSSYDPRGAVMIVYNQARDIESYNFYVIPVLDRVAYQITTTFGRNWTQTVLNNAGYNASVYARVPQALSPGIAFTSINLRPFDPPTAIPTVTIGLIYLIIIAFFSFTFFIPTHMKFVQPNPLSPHPPLKFSQLIIYRWCATIVAYLFLSLSYSLVSLAFQIPFSHSPPATLDLNGHWSPTTPVRNANYLGHGTWPTYWLLNFTGMAALGLTCENAAMLLTALSPLPFSALFLIFWVITNVSTGFYAIELASDFYKWGYVWPLRHIVEGSKTLVFGTRSQLGLNFGVLVVWVVVGTALFPVACWCMRSKAMKDRKRAAELEELVRSRASDTTLAPARVAVGRTSKQ